MNWAIKPTKQSKEGMVRRRAICKTPIGEFVVFESKGGDAYMMNPFMQCKPVSSFEYGLKYQERAWEEFVIRVNEV